MVAPLRTSASRWDSAIRWERPLAIIVTMQQSYPQALDGICMALSRYFELYVLLAG